jgi:hypothetical protein
MQLRSRWKVSSWFASHSIRRPEGASRRKLGPGAGRTAHCSLDTKDLGVGGC